MVKPINEAIEQTSVNLRTKAHFPFARCAFQLEISFSLGIFIYLFPDKLKCPDLNPINNFYTNSS